MPIYTHCLVQTISEPRFFLESHLTSIQLPSLHKIDPSPNPHLMGLSSKEVAVGDRLHYSQVGNNELEIEQLEDQQQQLLLLQCPRCESSNTKFCYYNNYSRLQPRHFCRACRRHWTAGGTLRNVPVGGGVRKNKRPKTAATAASGTIQQAAVGGAEGSTITDAFDQLMLPPTPMISSDGMTRTFITMDPYEEASLIDPLPLPASYCWTWWDDGSGSSAPGLE